LITYEIKVQIWGEEKADRSLNILDFDPVEDKIVVEYGGMQVIKERDMFG
jgi:hypothetical protein